MKRYVEGSINEITSDIHWYHMHVESCLGKSHTHEICELCVMVKLYVGEFGVTCEVMYLNLNK